MNKETIDEKVNCFDCLGLYNPFNYNNCIIHTYHITGNKVCAWRQTAYDDLKKLRIGDKHITLEKEMKDYFLRHKKMEEYEKLLRLLS